MITQLGDRPSTIEERVSDRSSVFDADLQWTRATSAIIDGVEKSFPPFFLSLEDGAPLMFALFSACPLFSRSFPLFFGGLGMPPFLCVPYM